MSKNFLGNNQASKSLDASITISGLSAPESPGKLMTDNQIYEDDNMDLAADTVGFPLQHDNRRSADNSVARMLWGHGEKLSINARVSEDDNLI
ncbi:hypothetical protein [Methylomusa anaerophila]|uniref:Uncharacterized protein n=1 Tax=Methylomusa anaerophila TaxID=1930071 RepID=A0A348AR10_9FIRM|nr:hypothetical protein [Methylomusa anaerophila]BBB93508.1 hypothetical protein MAMMFC1_04225 [Methylomusa anaerophila]